MSRLRARMAVLTRTLTGLRHLDPGRDRLLAAFPKSGSTWVRFVLCNLVSLRYWDGRPLDFPLLNRTLPELGASDLSEPWPWGELLPRTVKTHAPAWPLLRRVPAVLLVRDPADVMVSFHHHDAAQGGSRNPGRTLADFVRGGRFGVEGWARHTRSWMDAGATVVRYGELRADPHAGFRRLVDALGADVPDELLGPAVARSTLEATRAAEARSGADADFEDGFRFVRKGAERAGRAALSADDRSWMEEVLHRHGVEWPEAPPPSDDERVDGPPSGSGDGR